MPALNARKVIRALEKAGFVQDRQKGSHLILFHPQKKLTTVVPVHRGETISKPLLKEIINQSGLTSEQFLDLL
jgi:predicted RNA binding protein YcfA (HicA-like mRNA interferase family)